VWVGVEEQGLICGCKSCIITTMKQPKEATQTIKIWVKTQRKLKLLAALTHESMMKALDRLVEQELQRLRQERKEGE